MGKKESFEVVLARMRENGPLMMRDMLKLLTSAAIKGTGENVTRNELLAAAHMVSKEATKTAMAWSGEINKEDALLLLNVLLQAVSAFVTVCHGFTAGAGQTLLAAIRATATGVVESAAQLMEGCIDLVQRGAPNDEKATVLPKLAGRVWETCEAVKKAPTSNQVAVGRGLALLAATVKDTLREMGEMKETTKVDKRVSDGEGKSETAEGAGVSEGEPVRSEAAATGSNEASDTSSNQAAATGSNGASTTGNNGAGRRSDGNAEGTTSEGLESTLAESVGAASDLGDTLQGLRLAGASESGQPSDSTEADGVSSRGSEPGEFRGAKEPGARSGSQSVGYSSGEGERSKALDERRNLADATDGKSLREGLGVSDTAGTENGVSQKGGRAKVGNEGGGVSLPDDLGDMAEILDYNPEFDAEDMELVRAAVLVAENVLALLKQLLYVVAKWAPPEDWSKDAALNVLEMLHGDCSDICLQIEELGACLYPPQEIDSLVERTTRIEEKVNTVDDIVHEAIEGGPSATCKDAIAAALQACQDLKQLIAEGLEADSDD